MNSPIAPAEVQTSELPLDHIAPSGTHIQSMRRARFDPALLQQLADSIKEVGVLQAVVVRPTSLSHPQGYELVAGERRWLAAKLAGLTAIPATVRSLTDEQVLKAQLVENLQREGLHPLEEAEGYDELMKLDQITADQVATMIGKSRSYVFARLKLLGLDLEGRKAFYNGEIDASRALYVARVANPKLQAKALKLATQKGWKGELQFSVRSLRDQLTGHGFSVPLSMAPFSTADAGFVEIIKVKKGVEESRPLPDCIECPNRTGNCLDLFSADDDPDVCMEPACFEAKVRQFGERTRAIAEASGIKVITGDEAKKIAPTKHDLAGYVDLDAVCDDDDEIDAIEPEYPDDDSDAAAMEAYRLADQEYQLRQDAHKSRTFRQLLEGASVTPVVIEDPRDHRIRTLVPFKEAEKVLKKQHKITLSDWRHGSQSYVSGQGASETVEEKEARQRKEEAQLARQEQESKFRRELITQVGAKASAPLKREDLELIAMQLLADWDLQNDAEEFYGKAPKPGSMKEPELLSLIRVLCVIPCIDIHAQPGLLLDLARRLKIDPDKIKKELKAAAKAADKPEKKAAPKKAKKSR